MRPHSTERPAIAAPDPRRYATMNNNPTAEPTRSADTTKTNGAASAFETVASVITSRRTCLRLDANRPIEPAMISRLVELATWAPNHHRNEPWEFAVFTGDGRARFGETIAAQIQGDGAALTKAEKTKVKYLRAPTVLVVARRSGATDVETEENGYAVAAAIQNLLLGATSAGLASYWGSIATPSDSAVLSLCSFAPTSRIIAAIYLGHPTGDCPNPGRSEPKIAWHGS